MPVKQNVIAMRKVRIRQRVRGDIKSGREKVVQNSRQMGNTYAGGTWCGQAGLWQNGKVKDACDWGRVYRES